MKEQALMLARLSTASGVSAFFGPLSLRQYATHMVDHDIEHLAQMAAGRAASASPAR